MQNSNLEKFIIVKGAREHNLKSVSVDIPKNSLVVITGLSGSGKSSLAFDTIYAEGQRRYVESLSTYARQFLEQMGKPDVDALEGLCPSISIEQRTTTPNPRSTVGTITEIYDFLRLLWAKVGRPLPTGETIATNSVEQIVDQIFKAGQNVRVQIFAPLVVSKKGEHRKEIELARKSGFAKLKVNGALLDLLDEINLDKNKKHTLSILIDRLMVREDSRSRISKSVDSAFKLGKGQIVAEFIDDNGTKSLAFSTGALDPNTGLSLPPAEPRLFSFNSPVGACAECKGLGFREEFDPALIVANSAASILEGALIHWCEPPKGKEIPYEWQCLEALSKHYGFSLSTPFEKLPAKIQTILFSGSGKEEVQFYFKGQQTNYKTKRPFEGIIKDLERKKKKADIDEDGAFQHLLALHACDSCKGARLRSEALAYKINGASIYEVSTLPLSECLAFFSGLSLTGKDGALADLLTKEITSRLQFLIDVGLDYLDLSRQTNTLSGGETQRIRLATQIGTSLVGVLYVLDEPSIGLHQKDNAKLIESLKSLRDKGNSVIVVEHDRDTIEQADYIIDMGPGAGRLGGEIVAEGKLAEILQAKKSPTGRFLRGLDQIPLPPQRRSIAGKNQLELLGCSGNNLQNVDLKIPLGCFVCVSGVSGSGKSTLIFDTLLPALKKGLRQVSGGPIAPHKSLAGVEHLDKVIHVDQSPIGRSPRSNPATYSGLFTQIRTLFAQTVDAQINGFDIGRFSFNVKGGRCEVCEGDGAIKVEMHFLPDVYVPCHSCGGLRYNRETLLVKYKGKSIADVLQMTIDEALDFFRSVPTIEKFLRVLSEVGLGYVTLGQSATTLSGGEAQRMKLARELSKRPTGRTLYVLDEPSTGLHFQDIQHLLDVLHRLVDQGNTVLVIEHNLDILKHADYLVDLGPDGGKRGGQILFMGSPEAVAKHPSSHTAKFLSPYLGKLQ